MVVMRTTEQFLSINMGMMVFEIKSGCIYATSSPMIKFALYPLVVYGNRDDDDLTKQERFHSIIANGETKQ